MAARAAVVKHASVWQRLLVACHILRGRPGAYLLRFRGGELLLPPAGRSPARFLKCGLHDVRVLADRPPRVIGMRCPEHQLPLAASPEGWRCPMDDQVQFRVDLTGKDGTDGA